MALLILVSCGVREVDGKQLEKKNDVFFMPNEQTPFTGLAIYHYDNGQIREKSHYKDGLLDGECIIYKENGEVRVKYNYKDGKMFE